MSFPLVSLSWLLFTLLGFLDSLTPRFFVCFRQAVGLTPPCLGDDPEASSLLSPLLDRLFFSREDRLCEWFSSFLYLFQ